MSNTIQGVEPAKEATELPPGLTQEQLNELKTKHQELRLLSAPGAALVVRQPTPGEWDRFQKKVDANVANQGQAIHELVQSCSVWPAAADLGRIFERRPAYVRRFGMALVQFAAGDEETAKKDL